MTRFLHEKATDCLFGEKKVLGYMKAGEESSGLIERRLVNHLEKSRIRENPDLTRVTLSDWFQREVTTCLNMCPNYHAYEFLITRSNSRLLVVSDSPAGV